MPYFYKQHNLNKLFDKLVKELELELLLIHFQYCFFCFQKFQNKIKNLNKMKNDLRGIGVVGGNGVGTGVAIVNVDKGNAKFVTEEKKTQ